MKTKELRPSINRLRYFDPPTLLWKNKSKGGHVSFRRMTSRETSPFLH